eukprot:gnl/Chilomastix_cuspidata/666.p1 GENE.gnl/Chilomastix_cuspidata/666~~gnl/Chilomastix_cuspidata/666.p1  ORF type:complete len:479 (+),score=120.04 gnl/Chilomastix_cuspidata/666:189-1439(+)
MYSPFATSPFGRPQQPSFFEKSFQNPPVNTFFSQPSAFRPRAAEFPQPRAAVPVFPPGLGPARHPPPPAAPQPQPRARPQARNRSKAPRPVPDVGEYVVSCREIAERSLSRFLILTFDNASPGDWRASLELINRALLAIGAEVRAAIHQPLHNGFAICLLFFSLRHAQEARAILATRGAAGTSVLHAVPQLTDARRPTDFSGTLVVFNVPVCIDDALLRSVAGEFGEVLGIRRTPRKTHHRFLEFDDFRAARAFQEFFQGAAMDGVDLRVEFSKPGGKRAGLLVRVPAKPILGTLDEAPPPPGADARAVLLAVLLHAAGPPGALEPIVLAFSFCVAFGLLKHTREIRLAQVSGSKVGLHFAVDSRCPCLADVSVPHTFSVNETHVRSSSRLLGAAGPAPVRQGARALFTRSAPAGP